MAEYWFDTTATGANNGSKGNGAWQTIDDGSFLANDILNFERNRPTYLGELLLKGGNKVRGSGSGPNPIIDGSQPLANNLFSQTPAQTFTYQITISHDANSYMGDMAWEDGTRLIDLAVTLDPATPTIADVESTPGSFWWDSNLTLYIHPTGGTNPISDGKTYLGADVPHCIDTKLSDNNTITGIDCQRGWSNDQPGGFGNVLLEGDNNHYQIFTSKDSGRHGAQIIGANCSAQGGTIEDIIYSFGGSIFRDDSVGSYFKDLTIRNCSGYWTIHGTSGVVRPTDCYVEGGDYHCLNPASDIVFRPQMSDMYFAEDCYAFNNTYHDGPNFGSNVFTFGNQAGNPADNCRFYLNEIIIKSISEYTNADTLLFHAGSVDCGVFDNLFSGNNGTSRNTIRSFGTASTGNKIFNNMFYQTGIALNISSDFANFSINTNNYFDLKGTSFGIWNGDSSATTLSTWQTVSSQDANSLDVDPLFTDAPNDDYTVPSNSPITAKGQTWWLPDEAPFDRNGNQRQSSPNIGEFARIQAMVDFIIGYDAVDTGNAVTGTIGLGYSGARNAAYAASGGEKITALSAFFRITDGGTAGLALYEYNGTVPTTRVLYVSGIVVPDIGTSFSTITTPVDFTLEAGKQYVAGLEPEAGTAFRITKTGAGVPTAEGSSTDNAGLQATFSPDGGLGELLSIWADADFSSDPPELTTAYANQEFTLNGAVNLSVAGSWTNIDPNSFDAIDLPPGLSISSVGLITGNIRMGGIIDCSITVVGNNGQKLSAGFIWYERK